MRGLRLPKERVMEIPAALWKRAAAFLIDISIINMILLYPFRKYFKSLIPTTNYQEAAKYLMENPSITSKITVLMIMISVIIVLYFSISNYKTQTTLGKYLFRIKTKSIEKEAKYWQHLVSSLTFIPSMPFAILWIVDPIYTMMNEKKQRFMEKIAKLNTVEEVKMQ